VSVLGEGGAAAAATPTAGGCSPTLASVPEVPIGLYPIVTMQYSSITLYQVYFHIQ
jgi:hypothetical protein